MILFNLLVHGFNTGGWAPLNGQPVLGYVIANLVGTALAYRGPGRGPSGTATPRHSDGGRTAFLAISLVTMLIPMACLWISRNAMGLDDPVSDNVSANVIGLALANAARFVLTRQLVFGIRDDIADEGIGTPSDGRPVALDTGRSRVHDVAHETAGTTYDGLAWRPSRPPSR